MVPPLRLGIATVADGEQARRDARQFANAHGFSREDCEVVALAVSELAANLVRHARAGELILESISRPAKHGGQVHGVRVSSIDRGPGIVNIARAMEDGYSTGGGLGSGLPGARRLMDSFEIASSPEGTRIVACKWQTTRS
jgi:serine/threonine-protein kinase RsbT